MICFVPGDMCDCKPNSMVYAPHPDLVCKLIVQPGMACVHLVYCCHRSSVIDHELNMFSGDRI